MSICVSRVAARLPGVANYSELRALTSNGAFSYPVDEVMIPEGVRVDLGRLHLESAEVSSIKRSDRKVLSEDLLAGILCAGQLVHDLGDESLDDTALFTSTSVSFDRIETDISLLTNALYDLKYKHVPQRQIRVEPLVPPLMGLRALSNSANSYISQYYGIRGENTTVGNTSYDTWSALELAVRSIESGRSRRAVVGAMNAGGSLSAQTYSTMAQQLPEIWRECEAAVFLLLESADEVKSRGDSTAATIDDCRNRRCVPTLARGNGGYYAGLIDPEADLICFSGGLCDMDHKSEERALPPSRRSFSWHPVFGFTGPAASLLNIVAGSFEIQNGTASKVLCLDRDPYGRETAVLLGVC